MRRNIREFIGLVMSLVIGVTSALSVTSNYAKADTLSISYPDTSD